jgi:hypothetical protein
LEAQAGSQRYQLETWHEADSNTLSRYASTMRLQISAIGLLVVALLTPCATHAQQASSAKSVAPPAEPSPTASQQSGQPTDTLLLTAGTNHAPVSISLTQFRSLPHINLTVHNAHANADESYSGVPLVALLAKLDAPLGDRLRGKALASYLVATGSDGYSVVLSIAESDPSFHDGQVLVADTRDGQPLAKFGPFQLIVSADKRPARWVHNLVSISLQDAR